MNTVCRLQILRVVPITSHFRHQQQTHSITVSVMNIMNRLTPNGIVAASHWS